MSPSPHTTSERTPWTSRRHSALPLAIARVLFGTCIALDVAELIEYAPLWFDAVPYPAPVVPLLYAWLAAAIGLALGCFTRVCAALNYLACVAFLGFGAMPGGYEYHPDGLYILTSFGMIFLPAARRLSVDSWRRPPRTRTVGPLPAIFLALASTDIYFDSAIWKLSSRMWMEGLGYWAPASQPSDAWLALPWTLEHEWIARGAGYVTLAYELLFGVLVWFRRARIPLLLVGLVLHVGIGTVLPIPLFGLLMVALLVGLVPLRAVPDDVGAARVEPAVGFAGSARRLALAAFFTCWAGTFALGLVEPLAVLARHGFGGLDGPIPRPWHATSDSAVARGTTVVRTWSYRLLGWRSHPVFLDSQYAQYTTATRLVYEPTCGAPDTRARQGLRLCAPIRHRRWIAWSYRVSWPQLPRERAEVQLARFVTFHARRGGLDLEHGRVRIEQRAIETPVDAWRAGQRARNLASPWRTVGVMLGAPGALSVQWDDPGWL